MTRIPCAVTVLLAMFAGAASAEAPGMFEVLSYNIWVGGGDPGSDRFDRTVAVLKEADADVVGLQESGGNLVAFAEAAGYDHYDVDRQILSRHPIVKRLAKANRGGGVVIDIHGREVIVFNIHLNPYPYGPYDLVRDGKLTVEETEQQEYEGNRHVPDAQVVLGALAQEAGPGQPVFWTGDFNVPSHLDWTQAAADAGLNGGYIVEWPVSKMLQEAGFGDAWRDFHPDPVAHRGLTWTPSQPLDHPEEVHDRIDFVYYRGDVDLVEAEVIGEAEAMADRVVADYPSDHRAVLGTFRLAERDDLSADGAKNALDGQPVTNGALRRR